MTEKQNPGIADGDGDDSLLNYLENAPPPLRPGTPIGPPEVQPSDDDPIAKDE